MAGEVLIPELSWSFTLLCLSVVVMLLAMCVCSKQTEKAYFQGRSTEFGTAGRLSMTRDSPILQHQATNGTIGEQHKVIENESFEDEGGSQRNSWVVKDRALPDIPNVGPISADFAPAAMLNGRSEQEQPTQSKRKTHNKHAAPKPPTVEVSETDISVQINNTSSNDDAHVMTITVNERNQTKSDAAKPSLTAQFGSIHTHSWSQVMDCVPSSSDGSVVLRKIECSTQDTNMSSRLSQSASYNEDDCSTNPYAEPNIDTTHSSSSPVCIRIGQQASHSSVVTPAGLAVAGAVPSSDIPYMTPPLLHAAALGTSSEESPQRSENSQAGHSEIPYTVISVREPLARVREMTRKQRTVQQTSVDGENHYAMVPEEEQMYAEIGSGQDSGSSSITYAHIEPRELPPVPPTVESLKSVAHAHSRQASTVSSSSFGSCISGSMDNTSPTNTQLRNPSSCLYSSVEKNTKQRRTIHIAEGASVISVDKHKKVEDLYAKVRKKRVELTLSASSSEEYSGYQGIIGNDECMTPPPSPWASTTPPAPPPIDGRLQAASLNMLTSSTSQHMRRHSADPSLSERIKDTEANDKKHVLHFLASSSSNEPGYEQIYNDGNTNDSCYEKIKDEFLVEDSKSKSGFHSLHEPDVGYATVGDSEKDSADPGYECVTQVGNESISSDPGYEPVRISLNLDDEASSNHGYTTVNLSDETEPNYETVHKLINSESDAVDPGYERVKHLNRNDSDATDPGYEKVLNKIQCNDPGYETVRRSDSDSEPGYEIVRHQRDRKGIHPSLQIDTPVTVASPNSTILFVSGENSASSLTKEASRLKDFESEQDVSATFL